MSALIKTARINGREIYGFRVYGRLLWSGDLENLRETKTAARVDCSALAGGR